jgi:hypothetical protein
MAKFAGRHIATMATTHLRCLFAVPRQIGDASRVGSADDGPRKKCIGGNFRPHRHVIAISKDRAWVLRHPAANWKTT